MYSCSTPYAFTVFIILQCFVSNLLSCFGQDHYRYSNCSQPFDCGSLRNIRFPFWGHNRAEYCGQPGYKLRCEDDQIELAIETRNYRVLNIETDTQNLNIVPVDTLDDSCPAPSVNVSFPVGHFSYSLPDTVYVTMYYNCPQIPFLTNFSYPCSPYDNSTTNYIRSDRVSPWRESIPVWQCGLVVRVPILLRLADTIVSSSLSLQQVLREGFEVGYTMDSAFCESCRNSGGRCGYNSTTMRTMCFCYDGEYEGRCPTLRPIIPSGSVLVMGRFPTGGSVLVMGRFPTGVIAGIGCAILMALLFTLWKCRHSSACKILWERPNETQRLVEDFLKSHGSLVHKRYIITMILKR